MAELIQTVRPMAHDIVETTFRKALDEQISKAIGEASTYFKRVAVGHQGRRRAGCRGQAVEGRPSRAGRRRWPHRR